jgi:hypothetical protein
MKHLTKILTVLLMNGLFLLSANSLAYGDHNNFLQISTKTEAEDSSSLPSIEKRNADFKSAGITEDDIPDPKDELEYDLLWGDAKNHSLAELKKSYPKISANKLKKLMQAVGNKE